MILTVILAILTGFLVGAPTSKVEIQWCTRYGPGEISGWFEVQACCGVGVIHLADMAPAGHARVRLRRLISMRVVVDRLRRRTAWPYR